MSRTGVLGAVFLVVGALALIAPLAQAATSSTVVAYGAGGYRYQQVPHGGGSPAFVEPGFDDSSFSVGTSPFGQSSVCGNVAVTPWAVDTDLLVRRHVSLPGGTNSVVVHIAIDNDIELFWNGAPIGSFVHEGCATQESFTVTVPSNLVAAGDNLLAARALDRGGVAFLDLKVTANLAPDCTSLATDRIVLWPPNHKLHTVTVTGGTDPEGAAVTVAVTGVTQDEALDTTADGKTSPDADHTGLSANAVRLRAERSATGDGRVYRLTVTATDTGGASCSTTLFVGVPHDQRKGHPAIETATVVVNSFGSTTTSALGVTATTNTATTTTATTTTVPTTTVTTRTATTTPAAPAMISPPAHTTDANGVNNGAASSPVVNNTKGRAGQHDKP
jgi:hypothetical protein